MMQSRQGTELRLGNDSYTLHYNPFATLLPTLQ